jgi:phenylacetate-CoA ligase
MMPEIGAPSGRPGQRRQPGLYTWLVPHVLFPLYERWSGRRPWTELQRLRDLQWRSPAELETRALGKLRPLLEHAAVHVPYYSELFKQAALEPKDIRAISDLARLPITTKADLRANFPTRVVAGNLPARRRVRRTTSGSSGFPFEFYEDRAGQDATGSYLFFQDWAGTPFSMIRVRLVHRAELHPELSTRMRFAVRRLLTGYRVINLSSPDTGSAELKAAIAQFSQGDRYLIGAYPSHAARLGAQMLEEGLDLPLYPSVLLCGGETLTSADADIISRAFRCSVVNRYATWETDVVAQTCPDNSEVLHVDSERVILSVVRGDGSLASPGEDGRVVVTHLSNYVMPFINYDLGDRAVAGACSCGRGLPTIQSLDGRTVELIRRPDGTIVSPGMLCNLLTFRFPVTRQVWEFQAVQTAAKAVTLRVVPASSFDPCFAERLQRELQAFLGPTMTATVQTVDRIEVERSGKRLIIKSHLPGG